MEFLRTTTLLISFIAFISFNQAHGQNTPQDFVDAHKSIRSPLGLPPLTWDTTLEQYAINYAATRTDCALIHSGGPYGENVAFASWYFSAAEAIKMWADEVQFYDYDSNTCAEGQECRHYTQIVWRESTNVGCATVNCDREGWAFITCNYYPQGNLIGAKPY